MKALVLSANGLLNLEERPIGPALAEEAVLVKIAACGVCGSDIPRAFREKAYHYPLVMGHEFSGIISATGDRVAVFPLLPCKKCAACLTGNYAQCSDYNYFGSRTDGGLQEYLYVPTANLVPVPNYVNTLHAAMTEPAAVALHAVRKMHITAGDTGLVIGGGPIGNMAAQWLRLHGCREVIVAETDERKLVIAKQMGLTAVDAKKRDAPAVIMEITGGKGAAKVIEAVGLPLTCLQALQAAATYGEVVFMGNLEGTFSIPEKDFSQVLRKELKIYGTWNSGLLPADTGDWATVLKYMDKELQVAPLISDKPKLDEGKAIFESIYNRSRFHNKVIFDLA